MQRKATDGGSEDIVEKRHSSEKYALERAGTEKKTSRNAVQPARFRSSWMFNPEARIS